MSNNIESSTVAAYYDMWVDRFSEGEQAMSLSLHYGYAEDPDNPPHPEEAQMATNAPMADTLGLPAEGEHTISDLGFRCLKKAR